MASATLKLLLVGEDRSASKTLRGVGNEAGSASNKMGRLSKASAVMATGLLAVGAAAIKFGDQASDLAETQSKAMQIFGEESVDQLNKFGDAAAENLGQSKQQALDAAATFAMFGKSAGLAGDDLVGFSTEMTTLASDLASFNNTSPEEAIEAIGAALRGESEPIRKYGVLLDDATLRNEALRLGLVKTTKEALTPQQKVLAAQAAILKQTTDAQGDFARTSDGLANKNRILKAEFANLSTEMGAKALPIMLKMTSAGLSMLRWMEDNRKVVVPLVAILGTFAAIVVTINAAVKAYTAVQAALNVVLTANPIGLVVVAIAALVAGIVIAYKKSETFRTIVNGAFKAIATGAKLMWEVIRPVLRTWINVWLTVVGSIVAGAAKAFGWVPGIGGKLKSASKKFNQFKDEVNEQLGGIKDKNVKVNVSKGSGWGLFSTLAQLGQDLTVKANVQSGSRSISTAVSSGRLAGGTTIVLNGVIDSASAAREIRRVLNMDGVNTGQVVTV